MAITISDFKESQSLIENHDYIVNGFLTQFMQF